MESKEDARFKDLAFIDALTGIYNRYYLFQAVPEILQKAALSNSILGVLMLDVDNFKNINDTHGHLMGDEVLKAMAKAFQESIRGEDVVIRYAGDEFIVLLRARPGESGVFELAGKRIVEKVSKILIKSETGDITLTVSGGLSIYPKDAKTIEELIGGADKALYLSKERGKNRLSLSQEVTEEMAIKNEVLKLFPCPKFIDRIPDSESLEKALQVTLSGKTSLVLVKGKLGIGKTRLLDEFQKSAEAQKTFSIKIDASSRHTLMPYYCLSQVLEKVLKKEDILLPALASSLSQEEIKDIATLIPLFQAFVKEPSQKNTEHEEGFFIFKALRTICVELSYARSLFLYLDGIQWLDKATLELLNYLINYEFARKIIICAALDEDELKDDSPAREFLISPKDKINFISINHKFIF